MRAAGRATRASNGVPNRSATSATLLTSTHQGVELSQLELAYAITVHKAQGGEAAHVVLALSKEHGRMLTRRLLYTGASLRRAGSHCFQ